MAKRSVSKSAAPADLSAATRLVAVVGSEEMLKREHLDALRAALKSQHGDFETTYFHGPSAALADVLDEVRTYSLLQPFKMVILDEADAFLKKEDNRAALERYAENPVDQAVLVLRSGPFNYPRLEKALARTGGVVRCEPVNRAQARQWLERRSQTVYARKLDPKAGDLLVERIGADLMLLDSEMGKLAVLASDGQAVTVELVTQMVGRSSDEKAWAMQEAILTAIARGPALAPAFRGREMLEKVHEIVELAGNDEVPVYFAIADLMRKLCYAAILRQRGVDDFKIGKELSLWGPAKDAILGAARKVPAAQARRWFDRIMEMDLRNRTSLGDSLRNLEGFCAILADEL